MSALPSMPISTILRARRLRAEGCSWNQVSIALGTRSADGIRRRLDPEYHDRRNDYQARWQKQRRMA